MSSDELKNAIIMSCATVIQRLLRHAYRGQARRHVSAHVASVGGHHTSTADSAVDAFELTKPQLSGLMEDIHTELDNELVTNTHIGDMAK